jgi:ComF family protein
LFSQTLQHIRDGLLSLAYPQECRICHQAVDSWNDGVVCATCWEDASLTRLFRDTICCQKCNAPLPVKGRPFADGQSAAESESAAARTAPVEPQPAGSSVPAGGPVKHCQQCEDLPFSLARSCGAYAGALEASLLFLKSQPHICRRLRDMILQTLTAQQAILASDVLIPVPLHPLRRLERGFNQAELLAKLIASHFHIPLNTKALLRAKNTDRHRAGMDSLDRLKSVKGAFRLTDTAALKNASVLLTDDVFTTGSTLSEAARTLSDAGVGQVKVFTIAKVIRT